MPLGKDRLVFDGTVLADGDQIAAHIVAGGSVLTSTTVGANIGLDVNLINASIAVTASDLDIRSLDHTSGGANDSVRLGDGTSFLTSTSENSDLALDVHVSNTSIAVTQSGTWTIDLDGNVADDAPDSGDPVKTGTRAVFGAALAAISATNDRADMVSDKYRRLYVNDGHNVGVALTKPTIGDTAAQIAATAQAGRRRILVQNLSDKPIYIGPTNAVTTSTGIRVDKNGYIELPWGENLNLYGISVAGISSDVRVIEVA